MIYTDKLRLFGDDIEEVHALAEKIGLRRGWFNDHKTKPHYDIWETPLQLAIKKGAQVVKPEFMADFFKNKNRLSNVK